MEVPRSLPRTSTKKSNNVRPWSILPRTVCKPQITGLVVDWLGLIEPARGRALPLGTTSMSRHARAGQGLAPGSEIFPYLYNSNNPGTETEIVRVDTAPHGVETPTPLADC